MSNIEYRTSLTPIVSVAIEASGDNISKDVLSYEIGRRLSGKGSVTVGFTTVYGFNNGAIELKEVTSIETYLASAYTFIHIKNIGQKFAGGVTDRILKLFFDTIEIAILDVGASFVLSSGGGLDAVTHKFGYKVIPNYTDSGAYLDIPTTTVLYGAYTDNVVNEIASEDYILSTAMEILGVN